MTAAHFLPPLRQYTLRQIADALTAVRGKIVRTEAVRKQLDRAQLIPKGRSRPTQHLLTFDQLVDAFGLEVAESIETTIRDGAPRPSRAPASRTRAAAPSSALGADLAAEYEGWVLAGGEEEYDDADDITVAFSHDDLDALRAEAPDSCGVDPYGRPHGGWVRHLAMASIRRLRELRAAEGRTRAA